MGFIHSSRQRRPSMGADEASSPAGLQTRWSGPVNHVVSQSGVPLLPVA